MTIVIVGGGASGMMAALAAASAGGRVVLLERQARVGRKLLATGNGRCNLTNLTADAAHYHGADGSFCRPALAAFGPAAAREWFAGLGLLTVAEPSGRVYPYSDQANSVLDVLRFALEHRDVDVRTGCEVTRIWRKDGGFLLKTTLGDVAGERLTVAAGGAAGGRLGGTELGCRLLAPLGHRCTPLYPALVQLVTEGHLTRGLKGVRAHGRIAVCRGPEELAAAVGELQFTETGVSGPAAFDVSWAASVGGRGLTLRLNLLPELDGPAVLALLRRRRESLPELPCGELWTGVLHNRLGRVLVKAAGLDAAAPLGDVPDGALARAAALAQGLELAVAGTQGMDCAQVTAGGLETADFDPATLESRRVPGLYACGEVLDVDGDCGGYNLHWAWASGRLAGLAAAGEVAP